MRNLVSLAALIIAGGVGVIATMVGCNSTRPTEPDFPPYVRWSIPHVDTVRGGDTVFAVDTVTVKFIAADDGGVVTGVNVYVDGILQITLTSEPFQTVLDFSSLGNNRSVRIYATASDPKGNIGVTADTLKFTKSLPPDTATWTQLGAGPEARYGHTLSLDAAGKRAILIGGSTILNQYFPLDSAWEFDFTGNSWARLNTSGFTPPARREHAGGIASNLLVLFGGLGTADTLLEDYVYLDLSTLQWNESFLGVHPIPTKGMGATIVDEFLYLYGGSYTAAGGNNNSSEMWRFSTVDTSFTLVASSGVPGKRFRTMIATDREGGRIFLYGGRSGDKSSVLPTDASNYRYNLSTEIWASSAPTGPPPLESAAAIYDSLNNRILIWGGATDTGTRPTKLWQFSLGGRFWSEVPTTGGPPNGRTDFGMVKDPDSSRAILFGGLVSGNGNGETWELAW